VSEFRVSGRPIGPLLDALGVAVSLEPNQQMIEAVVIGKVVSFDEASGASTSLILATSGGLDWISQRGLLAVAQDVMRADLTRDDDDE